MFALEQISYLLTTNTLGKCQKKCWENTEGHQGSLKKSQEYHEKTYNDKGASSYDRVPRKCQLDSYEDEAS